MPLMLPHERVQCAPGNPVILLWESTKKVETQISNGGTVLLRELHYLQKIDGGLCHFGPTRKNTMRKEGLVIVVRMADLIEPGEFKQRVINMYRDGWLRFNDTVIHKYYDTDDVNLIDPQVVPWIPPTFA